MSKSKHIPLVLLACVALAAAAAWTWAADETKKPQKKPAGRDIEYHDVEDDAPAKPPIRRVAPPVPIDAVPGFLKLSNGDRVDGHIHLTRDAVLKIHDPKTKKIARFRLDELTHIEQRVVEEHMEREWRWLENANDEKVYTGRTYPMRKLVTAVHRKHGPTVTGPLTTLLFVTNKNGRQRFILHKRQKGKVGTTLKDLLYVKLVDFRPPEKK